jgi:hypothetical protein
MQNYPLALRRSSRVPLTVPILVTSMEPGSKFSEVCETTVVNAHGCAMRSSVQLDAGVQVHFHKQDGRETTAMVVSCRPTSTGTDRHSWMLAARFDQPDNFWGLKTVPKDWMTLPVSVEGKVSDGPTENVNAASVKIVLDRIRKQLSDEHLRVVLAELVRPLEAEVTELKNKMAQGTQKSRFEVSLSQIPPELEHQLELRLKQDLGPQVLAQAREQSEKVLEEARKAIDQKTKETHDQFLQRVSRDLQAVEQRTERIAANAGQNLSEHLNRGLGELHQEVTDAANRLKHISEGLLKGMERSLVEEHEKRTHYLEQMQAAVAAEALRLQQQISDLDLRMDKLDETARQLESGLDQRLSKMASDTVRTVRGQMEGALELALNQLSTRSTQELGHQVDEAGVRLKLIQSGIEASLAESLRVQVCETLQSFNRSMQELAELSVERWRIALTGGLNSLVRTLGEQFTLQAANNELSSTGAER